MGLSVVAQREAAGRVRARVRAGDASRGRGGSVRRVWLVSFLAFFLLGAGWALAMPYDGPPDELQHATRAYAVASGQIYAGPANAKVRTAKSLVPRRAGSSCWAASGSAPPARASETSVLPK